MILPYPIWNSNTETHGGTNRWNGGHPGQQQRSSAIPAEEGADTGPCATKDREKLSGWKWTCYLNMEQSGQSGPHSGAQVTQQAVGEGDDFLRTLSPTPAPLIHQPERIYVGLSPNLFSLCLSLFLFLFFCRSTDGFRDYSQEEWEQQGERREKAEADGDAKSVCVLGQTGGDGIYAEFHQTGENCGGISSDQRSTIHVGRVCMAFYWDQSVCKLVMRSGEEGLGRSSSARSVWRTVWNCFIRW